jgi:hypothetical protein
MQQARAPERHASKKTTARVPLEGRIEKRVRREVLVRLMLSEPSLLAEKVITVNVSPRGARLVTRCFWRAGELPWLAPLTGDLRQRARVVYCQPLPGKHFCVGLEFRPPLLNWADPL